MSAHKHLLDSSNLQRPQLAFRSHAKRRALHRPLKSAHHQVCAAADAAELIKWAQRRKLDTSKQAVQPFLDGASLQLRCERAVGKGDTLLTVPDNLWLSSKTVADSSIGPLVDSLPLWLQLALVLIAERAAGSNSPWAGYIQSLPEAPPSPLFWGAAERRLLEATQLLQSLQGYEEYFEEQYAQLSAGLFAEHGDVFPPDVFSSEAFRWAAVLVRARSHPPLEGPDLALVPIADLAGHSRRPGVSIRMGDGGILRGSGRTLKLVAARALAEGELVDMDFGSDKVDSQLLLDYGVLDEEEPQGGYLLALSLSEDDRNFDDKADILDINGFGETWQFALRAGRAPESGLLAFLRLINCSGPDAFMLEALFRNEVWGFMLQPVSQGNEEALCRSMVDGCRQALAAYPSTIDEDLELLRDAEAAPRGSPARAALLVRLGEKEGLDSSLRFFEDRLSRLDRLEYYQERRLKNLGLMDRETGESTWDGFFEDGVA